MKVLISKVLYFEKYLLFWKRKKIKHDHPNFQYVLNRETDTVVLKFSYCFIESFIASKYISIEKFSHCCMLLWFSLGRVIQNMGSSLYDRRSSVAQTYSFDLMKMNKVTSNAKQPEPSETNKITSFITSAPYIGNTQIHSSCTD